MWEDSCNTSGKWKFKKHKEVLLPQEIKVWQYQVVSTRGPSSLCLQVWAIYLKNLSGPVPMCPSCEWVGVFPGRSCEQSDSRPPSNSGWAHLGRKIAAELELLQGQGHRVCPEEKDEGHECQVGDELAGVPEQAPTVVQTLLLAQQGPVQCCEVKGVVLGDQAQERKGQSHPHGSTVPPAPALPSLGSPHAPPALWGALAFLPHGPATEDAPADRLL